MHERTSERTNGSASDSPSRWLCPQGDGAWWARSDGGGGWWLAREPDHRPFRVAAVAPLCLRCGATLVAEPAFSLNAATLPAGGGRS